MGQKNGLNIASTNTESEGGKMKIYVGHSHNVEVVASDLYEECPHLEAEAEVTEEEWKDYNRVLLEYMQWQDKLEWLADNNVNGDE